MGQRFSTNDMMRFAQALFVLWFAIVSCNLLFPSSSKIQIPTEARLPEPPASLPVPPGTPEEQAVALADATGPDSPDFLAGWLATYDALGIPVFRPDGSPLGTTGDDPIGPPFWRVWYMSGMARSGPRFSLTDFAKAFNTAGNANFDSAQAGQALLEDLRTAVVSEDPKVRLLGLFVTETVKRGPASLNLLDPAVTAEQVMVTGDVAELLSWVAIRGLVFDLARAESSAAGAPRRAVPVAAHAHLARPLTGWSREMSEAAPSSQAADKGCGEIVDSDTAVYWINWAVSQVMSGVQLPGMEDATKSFIEVVQKYLGASENAIERTGTVIGVVNSIGTVLSLAMLLSSLRVDSYMDPDPLERTKTTTDGKTATIYFRLMVDPDQLPDGNNRLACLASWLAGMFGVTFSFPASGRVAGAEMVFEPGQGFGDYVLFGDYRMLRQDTNANGEVSLLVIGKAQKQEIPDEAEPMLREFSIHVSAQPEPVTGTTLFNVFWSGLSFGANPSASGLIIGAVEVLKTFHWDLGEHFYRLQDWSLGGFDLQVKTLFTHETGELRGETTLVPLTFSQDGTFVGSAPMEMTLTIMFTPHDGRCDGSGTTTAIVTAEGSINPQSSEMTLALKLSVPAEDTYRMVCVASNASWEDELPIASLIAYDGSVVVLPPHDIPLLFGTGQTFTLPGWETTITLVEKTNP